MEEDYQDNSLQTLQKKLQQKAEEKQITQAIVLRLLEIILDEEDDANNDKLMRHLLSAYNCQNELRWFNGCFIGRRCKTRFCLFCSRIRTLELTEQYMLELESWDDAQFLTLSLKSVTAEELESRIDDLFSKFRKLKDLLNGKSRVTGVRCVGIRTFECDYDPKTHLYNPHFHLILKSKEIADLILDEWLTRKPTGLVSVNGQYLIEVYSKESLLEYCTKFFANKKLDALSEDKEIPVIHAKAQLNIVRASKKHYSISPFGFILPKKEKKKKHWIAESVHSEKPIFDDETKNWICLKTNEFFTDSQLSQKKKKMLDLIDTKSF